MKDIKAKREVREHKQTCQFFYQIYDMYTVGLKFGGLYITIKDINYVSCFLVDGLSLFVNVKTNSLMRSYNEVLLSFFVYVLAGCEVLVENLNISIFASDLPKSFITAPLEVAHFTK